MRRKLRKIIKRGVDQIKLSRVVRFVWSKIAGRGEVIAIKSPE